MIYHRKDDPYDFVEAYQYTSQESLMEINKVSDMIPDRGQFLVFIGFVHRVVDSDDFLAYWKPYQHQLDLFEG